MGPGGEFQQIAGPPIAPIIMEIQKEATDVQQRVLYW